MIHYVNGSILEADVQYICHQVNCQGKMNSGIAKAIRDKWPKVYDQYIAGYKEREEEIIELCGQWESQIDVSETLLGNLQQIPVNDKQTVVNMFAQQWYGYDGKRYTSYDAFWTCLGGIRDSVPKGSTIGFPDHIGSCRGGANWEVIRTMIEQVLGEDFEVYIYKWEG